MIRLFFGLIFLQLILGLNLPAYSNTSTAQALILEGIQMMDQAYNHWDRKEFESAAEKFQQAIDDQPDDYLGHYWKGAALFYLASYYLHAYEKDKNPGQGVATVDEGLVVLTQAIEKNPAFSESHALRGVLRGMHIQLNPWSIFTQGPGVQSDRDRALALNPDNPRVHYLTGISLWMAPEIFGGGATEALKHFLRAEELFAAESQREKSALDPVWGYSTCLSFIGDVYARQGDRKQAYRYYQKALMQNPADRRAKDGLEQLAPSDSASKETKK
jgi:tetratricopeptide (TPR) repeat protein